MPLTFVASYLRSPQSIGAVVPSSAHLAQAIAAQVGEADALFEIGAGTGAITAALCKLPIPLAAVEQNQALAAKLRARFPDITVLAQSLEHCESELAALPEATAFVSSLPFKSLPAPVAKHLAHILASVIRQHPKRRLIQFSYFPTPPFPAAHGLHWACVCRVWRNLPPAFVWVLSAATYPPLES